MNANEFKNTGFYYNNGQLVLKVGDIIEDDDAIHYKVIQTNSGVLLEEGETHELKDPTNLGRDFFHGCHVPTDPSRIPHFTY